MDELLTPEERTKARVDEALRQGFIFVSSLSRDAQDEAILRAQLQKLLDHNGEVREKVYRHEFDLIQKARGGWLYAGIIDDANKATDQLLPLILAAADKAKREERSLIRAEVEKIKRESPEPGWIPHEHWYEACDRILEALEGK